MAFPPNFTRAWDETFPPDTQAANLLGQDLRNGKADLRERMALLSGTFANRPTPDAVFGGAGYGTMYFSTDTNQVFQWNGAAWLDVTFNIGSGIKDYDDYTPVLFVTAAPGPIRTVSIPTGGVAQGVNTGSFIEIESQWSLTGQTGVNPQYVLKVNGVILSVINCVANQVYSYRATIALSSTSLPRCSIIYNVSPQILIDRHVALALGTTDGTAPVVITDSFANATTLSCTVDYMHVRVRK